MMRLERRHQASRTALVLAPIGAVAFTLAISALLVLWAGAPVGRTYALLLQGGFGSVFAWSETLTRAIPLIDYWAAMHPLNRNGIDADGIHPNIYRNAGDAQACTFTADALRYGYNMRNITALLMLDRLRALR